MNMKTCTQSKYRADNSKMEDFQISRIFDPQHDVIETKCGGKGTNFLSPEIKMI